MNGAKQDAWGSYPRAAPRPARAAPSSAAAPPDRSQSCLVSCAPSCTGSDTLRARWKADAHLPLRTTKQSCRSPSSRIRSHLGSRRASTRIGVAQSRHFSERDPVKIEVDLREPLGAACARAAELLTGEKGWPPGRTGGHGWIVLQHDDAPMQAGDRVFCIRDELGRATWVRDKSQVTFSQIFDAVDVGLLVGDPRRINLVLGGGWGDGFLTFQDLLTVWEAVEPYIEGAAKAKGAWDLSRLGRDGLERAQRRLRRARGTLESAWADWAGRGATLPDVLVILRRDLDPEVKSAVLGISVAEVEALEAALPGTEGDHDAERQLFDAIEHAAWRFANTSSDPADVSAWLDDLLRHADGDFIDALKAWHERSSEGHEAVPQDLGVPPQDTVLASAMSDALKVVQSDLASKLPWRRRRAAYALLGSQGFLLHEGISEDFV